MSLRRLRRVLIRAHVIEWYRQERKYADVKYPTSTVEQHGGVLTDDDINFVTMYLSKARHFGLDNPKGRQQLAKAASTLMHFTEGAVVLHGPLPQPGNSTNDITEWENAPPT